MSNNSVDLKIVLLGHKNVGKTSVFNRYVYDDFGKTSMTIGAYFAMKQCRIEDKSYNLAIWDTAGEEKFDSLTNFYCRNARAAIITYDVTNYETFAGLQRWVDKIAMEAEQNCVIVIVGNKYDMVQEDPSLRKVDFAEVKKYAKTVGAEAYETSAATGYNVVEIFTKVVLKCLELQTPAGRGKPDGGVAVDKKGDKKPCCK